MMIWVPILAALVAMVTLTWLARTRWPVIAVVLYASWVTIVFMPVVLFVTMWLGRREEVGYEDIPGFFRELYGSFWPFWIFCAVVITSEAFLLILPVRVVKRRPSQKRGLWATAVAAAALFAIITVGSVWSVVAAVFGDGSIHGIVLLLALAFLLLNWVLWSCVFRAFARNTDPRSYIRRLMKWLLRGTIVELLIAVPSHVIVRHRDVCCADGVTALGIATGFAVMLISFGPGIYFLYAERIESKKTGTQESRNEGNTRNLRISERSTERSAKTQ